MEAWQAQKKPTTTAKLQRNSTIFQKNSSRQFSISVFSFFLYFYLSFSSIFFSHFPFCMVRVCICSEKKANIEYIRISLALIMYSLCVTLGVVYSALFRIIFAVRWKIVPCKCLSLCIGISMLTQQQHTSTTPIYT